MMPLKKDIDPKYCEKECAAGRLFKKKGCLVVGIYCTNKDARRKQVGR